MAWLVIALVALLLFPAVHAVEGFSVIPSSLNITGTAWTIESRTLNVVANESVTGLELTAFDLTKADGNGVIRQQFINTENYTNSMAAGAVQKIPVTFNLGNVSSGSYSGEIWVRSSNNSRVIVPVTMTLKDDLNRPALILVFAVIVSYGLFVYGSRFRAGDEIRRTLRLIRESFDRDKDCLKHKYRYDRDDAHEPQKCTTFYDQIKSDIEQAEFNLEIPDVPEAEKFMKNAQKNWTSWTSQRPQLLSLFSDFNDLIENLNAMEDLIDQNTTGAGTPVRIISLLRKNLQKQFNRVIDEQGSQNLDEAITKNGGYYNDLYGIIEKIEYLQKLCKGKDCQPCTDFKEKRIWYALTDITAEQGIDIVKSDIETIFKDALEQCPPVIRSTQLLRVFERRLVPQRIPVVGDPTLRLLLYDWGMFLVTVSALAMAGFFQLYLSNPTFGSLSDYITLALWGLMAGPSADAITTKAKTTVGIS